VKQFSSALFTALRILTGVGLLVYLAFSDSIAWSELAELAGAWEITLSALGLLLVIMGLTSWRLCLLLEPRGLNLSLGSSFRLTLIGAFFNTFLPGGAGGDIVRIYYAMKGNEGRRTEIATIILLDRLFGTLGLLLLPLLLAPFFPQLLRAVPVLRGMLWVSGAAAAAMLGGLFICFAGQAKDGSLLLRIFQKLPLGNYAKRIYETVRAYRHDRTTLVNVLAISLLVHSLLVVIMLLLVHVTSTDGVRWSMAVVIPLGFLANTVPLTPGGLGVGEVAFRTLFQLGGFTGGVEALLGWRVLNVLIALPGLIFHLQGRKDFLFYAAQAERTRRPEEYPLPAD
jgi:glycosyltransferase 2 family protein